MLLCLALPLLLSCGDKDAADDTAPLSSTEDGGIEDGGIEDGGSSDGGSSDGGTTDGGVTDGGSTDGGSTDPALAACTDASTAAASFLASLDGDQLAAVQQPLDSPARQDWTSVPGRFEARDGLYFKDLDDSQRLLLDAVIAASLSSQGATQVTDTLALDQWWKDGGDTIITPEYTSFVFFGEPAADGPWAWQLDGHHLAISFTASCPAFLIVPGFWGAQPEEGLEGDIKGLRAMGLEIDTGVALLFSLDAEQLDLAVTSTDSPAELFAGVGGDDRIPGLPEGVSGAELDDSQRALLVEAIAAWVDDAPDPQAALRMLQVEDDLDDTWFSWRGPTEEDGEFYFRIHGPSVWIEVDHNGTDEHLHGIHRDPVDDYGAMTLADHYDAVDHGR